METKVLVFCGCMDQWHLWKGRFTPTLFILVWNALFWRCTWQNKNTSSQKIYSKLFFLNTLSQILVNIFVFKKVSFKITFATWHLACDMLLVTSCRTALATPGLLIRKMPVAKPRLHRVCTKQFWFIFYKKVFEI